MGVDKKYRINKNYRRPKKTESVHRRKIKAQKRRIVAFGFKAEEVEKWESGKVRDMLMKIDRKSTRKLLLKRLGIGAEKSS